MNEEILNTIEEDAADVPQEVKDFIFSDTFDGIKNEILKIIDKEDERLQFSNAILFFLFGGILEQQLDYTIRGLTIEDSKKEIIRKLIKEKVIDEILAIIEASEEIDKESTENPVATTPTPLSSLADRLKQASIAAPVKRDYSLPSANEAPVSKPAIDPYHEQIDNV